MRASAAVDRARRRFRFPWGAMTLNGHEFVVPTGSVALTRNEALILRALLRARGRPVPREALTASARRRTSRREGSRTIDAQIAAIRRKVRATAPEAGRLILCARQTGISDSLISQSGNGSLEHDVKEPLKLPFIFLFVLLCTTIVLGRTRFACHMGRARLGHPGLHVRLCGAEIFPDSLFAVTIPSVVFSIVILGFRMARKPISRFVGFLIVLAVGYVALVNGMIWFHTLAVSTTAAARTTVPTISPSTFVRLGGRVVSVESISSTSARGVLVFDPASTHGAFTLSPSAGSRHHVEHHDPDAVMPAARGGRPISRGRRCSRLIEFTAAFLRDVATITAHFSTLLGRSMPELFFACFSLVFLCAAQSLMLLRLTRWPLVNIMLLIIPCVRVHSGSTIFSPLSSPPGGADHHGRHGGVALSFHRAGRGRVILLLIAILLHPADRWAREEISWTAP